MNQGQLLAQISLAAGPNLRNRIEKAPMPTSSGDDDDGVVSEDRKTYVHLPERNVGLAIAACTHFKANEANDLGFTGEFAADHDLVIPGLHKLAQAAKSDHAPVILQLFHAGTSTRASLAADMPSGSAAPGALQEHEIVEVIDAFAAATRRAIIAGFDGIELCAARGSLLQNFLSPHANQRTDAWGGSLVQRMHFPLAVLAAVKQVIEQFADRPFALGYRISVEEGIDGGLQMADSLELISRLIDSGASYIHAARDEAATHSSEIFAADSTIVSILHKHIGGRVPLLAAGRVQTPQLSAGAVGEGAVVAVIGKGLVINPDRAALARTSGDMGNAISAPDVSHSSMPKKLWKIISNTPGWFM